MTDKTETSTETFSKETEIVKEIVFPQRELIDKTFHLVNEGKSYFSKIAKEDVEEIIYCYEDIIQDCLKQAKEPDTKIIVKIFNGLQVIAQYVPAGKKKLYGKVIDAKEKISVKAKTTKHFGYFLINDNVRS